MSPISSEPTRLEHDLEQTRARLDGHLSELQSLSPGQVLDDLMRYFRGKEGAEFGRNLVGSVRGNPIPAAVTGIGLTWLMATNPRSSNANSVQASLPTARTGTSSFDAGGHKAMTVRVRDAGKGVVRRHDESEPTYATRLDDARGRALGLARHEQDTHESFAQRISHALASAQQAVTGQVHDLRDGAGIAVGALEALASSVGHSVGQAAHRAGGAVAQGSQATGNAGGNLIGTLTESPVLLGALGLAAGALLGALIPQSDREEAALGQLAGQARDGARSLAQTAVDGGAHVAQSMLDKGRESVQAHGLSDNQSAGGIVDAALGGGLSSNVKQVAEDLLEAGEAAVRKELHPAADDAQPSRAPKS